jgi:hypothetical protein
MALSASLSPKELERVAVQCYETQTLKVMLCSVGLTGYNSSSTVANWQSVEQVGNGYVRSSTTIGAGSYNATSQKYLLPTIDAIFNCTSGSIIYDSIVLYIDGQTYPHSVLTESPNATLQTGQSVTYRLNLSTDD